jgi:hypothetical protein
MFWREVTARNGAKSCGGCHVEGLGGGPARSASCWTGPGTALPHFLVFLLINFIFFEKYSDSNKIFVKVQNRPENFQN